MAAIYTILLAITLVLLFVNLSLAFDPLKRKNKIWTHFDFTVSLSPQQRECYHQYVETGMIFSLSYKVVFGDQHDRNFGFVVTDFNGKIVKENYEDLEGNMQVNAKESGVYNICIGNQASRFYSKKIHIYLDLFNPKRFESAVEEETEKDHSFGNISKTIMVLNEGIRDMRLYQMRTRQNSIHDWYILSANLAYVNRWSCVQCIVIIASGILQVYILRTLFTVPTNTRKPRC